MSPHHHRGVGVQVAQTYLPQSELEFPLNPTEVHDVRGQVQPAMARKKQWKTKTKNRMQNMSKRERR